MPDRVKLSQISPRAWEHPADRAALNTLRALPGFDQFVRKIMSFLGERGVRQMFLANAVRVGPKQRPKLDALYTDVLETLDWPVRNELYVSQTPVVNAFAVGFEQPFIVLNSGMINLLEPDERREVIAHELGHIMSGHATYTTLALILLQFGFSAFPLAGIALLPIQLALFEWYRKAEFSSDRAGLLGCQDPLAAMRVSLKLAGGGAGDDSIDLDAFLAQAAEYETQGGLADKIWQILNTAFKTHPFNTVRAAELQRWVQSGDYDRILRGEYPKRGEDDQRPLGDDYADAAGYYGEQTRGAMRTIDSLIDNAKAAFSDALGRKKADG